MKSSGDSSIVVLGGIVLAWAAVLVVSVFGGPAVWVAGLGLAWTLGGVVWLVLQRRGGPGSGVESLGELRTSVLEPLVRGLTQIALGNLTAPPVRQAIPTKRTSGSALVREIDAIQARLLEAVHDYSSIVADPSRRF